MTTGQGQATLPPVAQPVTQEVFELGNRVNLVHRRVDIVFDAAEANGLLVEQNVTRPPVAVAGLSHRTDVAERLAAIEVINVIDVFGAVELVILGENARNMRVPLKAISLNQGEDALHLALVVDVFRKNILV